MRTIQKWAKLTGRLRSLLFWRCRTQRRRDSDPVRGGGGLHLQDWAEAFYSSAVWKQCRTAYKKRVGGLCERCLKKGLFVPGEIVHHKIHLTPENINNPSISCNNNNLELLCRDCHSEIHSRLQKRYKIDEYGRVITERINADVV